MQMNTVEQETSQDNISLEQATSSENAEMRELESQAHSDSSRTIFVVTSEGGQRGQISQIKVIEPPRYEEIEPPPAYEP